jgi:ATP-dependent helicase HepA
VGNVFVRAKAGDFASLGIGKLVDRKGDVCSVEYFDAPVFDPVVHSIGAHLVESVTLAEQTRVYHFNPTLAAWEIGRLIDDLGTSQYVRFPNGSDRQLAASEVFVRWARPISEPSAFLGGKINETPRFADGRSGFVQSLITQRAVTMGISALASSAIELEAHQIEVVRRVLQDPVQRYLLADEVGLGKTIEAGILIRQCFLDGGDDIQVMVIAPDALVPQWQSELVSKFFLGHCLGTSLHIVAFSDSDAIKELLGRINMLVIDEAHHLTGRRASRHPELFGEIATAAPHIERVLLLSATPALHNEQGFLEMLHLLDPDNYALDDVAGFRKKIESRQTLAQIVAGLTPDNALFLDDLLDRLCELFPEDGILQDLARALRAITDTMPTEGDPDLLTAIGHLRAHLSEVYRLHRRILRHRRRNIDGLTPNRAGAIIVDYHSGETGALANAVEDWRFGETVALASEGSEHGYLDRARVLEQVLDQTLKYARSGRGAVGLLVRQSHLLGDTDRFGVIVGRLGNEAIFEARLSALVSAIKPMLTPRQQFVVFCSDGKTADALTSELANRLQVPVDRHCPNDDQWLAFNSDASRTILVCDRIAEEGLNLQGGQKIVVHYDLPLNSNRIEQRLGRADRYGSGVAVKSIVLNCLDNPIEGAWISYLDKALRVFDRSIASLQYLIEETTRGLRLEILTQGVEALLDLTEVGAGDDGLIEREMRNIDQQDALDSLGVPSTEILDALCDIDDDWENWEEVAAELIEQMLQFARIQGQAEVGSPKGATPFRYRYATSGRHTLIPLETFYTNCKSSVDVSTAAVLSRTVRTVPVTFRRRTALSRLGRAEEARLLRYGDPFVSGMWSITQGDDRGRSAAMWRLIPGYQPDGVADLYFRFDYIVSVDLAASENSLAEAGRKSAASEAAIRRRGDMALPPFLQTIWLNRELEPVTDAVTLARLNLPYHPEARDQGGRDFNLNPKRWRNLARLDVPEQHNWSGLCAIARQKSEAHLRALPSFVRSLEEAVDKVAEVDFGRLGQLRARAERSKLHCDRLEWSLEAKLSDALQAGMREPHIHLDTILACFMTGNSAATVVVAGRG